MDAAKSGENKVKVTFVISTNTSGGAERVISVLCNYLSTTGDSVSLINFDKESHFYQINEEVRVVKLAEINPKISKCKSPVLRLVQIYKSLKKELSANRPDVVIPFLFNAELPVIVLSKILNIPCITSVRNSPEKYPKYQIWFRKILYPKIGGVVLQSDTVLKHPFFKNVTNKTTIMNPLSCPIIGERPKRTKGKIIAVGRLCKQKNHMLIVESLPKILKQCPETVLYIYGTGELEDSLRLRAEELEVSRNLVFEGSVMDAIPKNNDAQLFVMSSDYEGFPNALLEAMACHIPVVCTDFDTGVARDLLGDDKFGELVQVGNREQLTEAIVRSLIKDEDSEIKADLACDLCKEFSPRIIGEQWREFIKKVIEQKRQRSM